MNTQEQTDAKNRATSAREVAAFKRGTVKPGESYTAYLTASGAKPGESRLRIVTWMGDTLATVTAIRNHKTPLNAWLSDVRGSFWARGIDGRIYHGRHNGAGIYCRMRLSKRQPA